MRVDATKPSGSAQKRDEYAEYVDAMKTGKSLPPAAEIDRIVAAHIASLR